MSDLLAIHEARRRVLAEAWALADEEIPLEWTLGRVLAEDVTASVTVPPFDSSAMDGFALAAGPASELDVVGEARAGHPYPDRVAAGTAVRISTGAVVPDGADAVVPVERAEDRGARVVVPEVSPDANVRRAGEDVRSGDVVLRRGDRLGPAEIGVAASVGRPALRCSLRPRVALVVTGDELAKPGEDLPPGRIYGSNAYSLAAQVERAGAELAASLTAEDTAAGTRARVERALADADVVCVSGGVSVGPHDHVRGAMSELGVKERFWGVALKPGKPTWFGVRDGTLAFGLPGNPVSAMVTFQLFVRPLLAALQGADPNARRVRAVLAESVPANPRREQAVRVRLSSDGGLRAEPTGPQGSHILTSMLGADGLALIPAREGELAAGEPVEVELL
ncbi:MAG TPA: gephyrin-like molybdotransferase Glp [Thermoleophilaceae bacterium]|nr:gephyrin-like molybdotransferase Glp [Thermoleophilaceae bacterium]